MVRRSAAKVQPHRWWWSFDTVRIRVTASAILSFTLALALSAALVVMLVRSEIEARLVNEAAAAAEEILTQLDGDPGAEIGSISWHPESVITYRVSGPFEDRSGSARPDSAASTSSVPDVDVDGAEVTTSDDGRTATVVAVADDGSAVTVEVTATARGDDLATGLVTSLMKFALPGLVLVVTVVTWHILGRALSRVEEVRAAAEEIGDHPTNHSERLPVPRGHDELTGLVDTLNRMLDELAASTERQRSFISDAGHELRTPIAVLSALVEAPDGGEAQLDKIRDAARRLRLLVEDLFTLAKLDEWGVPTNVDVDVDAVVDDAVDGLAGDVLREGVNIDTSGVHPARVRGDDAALGRAVTNLVANAIRHARSEVRVEVRQHDGRCVVTVDDDGAGIEAADRARVFDRFTRLDEGRARDAGGSGLGLAIVDEIARAHGGTASAVESPLGGARFELALPNT